MDAAKEMRTSEEQLKPDLGFSNEVAASFKFLCELGYRIQSSAPTLVRFESHKLSIDIYYGRTSFEIGLEISGPGPSRDSYSMSEILRLVDPKRSDRYSNYAAHTAKGVTEGVRQLAKLFRYCVSSGMFDAPDILASLKAQRLQWALAYSQETRLEQARKQAEIAWAKKDYRAVVKTYRPLRASLSPVELKKLEYAEKRMQD